MDTTKNKLLKLTLAELEGWARYYIYCCQDPGFELFKGDDANKNAPFKNAMFNFERFRDTFSDGSIVFNFLNLLQT